MPGEFARDPRAMAANEPATFVVHKRDGVEIGPDSNAASICLLPDARAADDVTGIQALPRHFKGLSVVMPLEPVASGLLVITQDPRLLRRIRDEGNRLEQEFIVEVSGEIAPYGLPKLNHGLQFNGRNLPPCKVSWQNEIRLRFAIKGVQAGQLHSMCADVGLEVVAIKRIRIGRVPLARMPVGQWRYLATHERL